MVSTTTYAHIGRKASGKAVVEGTRIAVADIASLAEEGLSPSQIQEQYDVLTLAQIHAALAYYYDHRDEIAEERKRAEEAAENLRHRFPDRIK